MAKDPEKGRAKETRATPLLFSCRLTFFMVCLFATFNVILQRMNINFALVCMVKSPSHHLLNDSFDKGSQLLRNESSGLPFEIDSTTFPPLDPSLGYSSETDLPAFDSYDYEYETCQPPISAQNQTHTASADGEFEWDKAVQGNILGSFYYGYIFTQVLGGWASDRFGGRIAFIGSMAVLSLLTLLNPIAAMQGPAFLFVVRMLMGLSQGAAMPVINVLSARWSGHTERAFLIGIAYGGFTIAAFVSNPLCALICQTAGWSFIFYITGGMGLLWCIVAYFFVYNWPEDHPRISTEELEYLQKNRAVQPGTKQTKRLIVPWKEIALSGPVNVVHLVHFCTLWGFTTLTMYLPAFLKEVLHMDIRKNGLLSSVPYLGMMVLHWGVGPIFDALRRRGCCSVTNLRKGFNTLGLLPVAISLSFMGLIPCTDNTAGIVLISLGQSFGELALMGGYFFSIFELAPRFSGILTGVTNTFGVLTGFLCPAMVSYLTPNGTREEWLVVFYISSAFTGFGTLIYLLFGSSQLQSWAEPKTKLPKITEMQVLQEKLISKNEKPNGETAGLSSESVK